MASLWHCCSGRTRPSQLLPLLGEQEKELLADLAAEEQTTAATTPRAAQAAAPASPAIDEHAALGAPRRSLKRQSVVDHDAASRLNFLGLSAVPQEEDGDASDSSLSETEWRELAPDHRQLSVRRGAVSAEAERRSATQAHTVHNKTTEHRQVLRDALADCPIFPWKRTVCSRASRRSARRGSLTVTEETIDEAEDLDKVVDVMPVEEIPAGEWIFRKGDVGEDAFVCIDGNVEIWDEDPKHGPDSRGSHPRRAPPVQDAANSKDRFVSVMQVGRVFGELSMLWNTPRALSVYAREPCILGRLRRRDYHDKVVYQSMRNRRLREETIRKVEIFETFGDEDIARLADVLEKTTYEAGEEIIKQDEDGSELFVVLKGQCVAQVATGWLGQDVQEHMRYEPGDCFGERALMKRVKRGATVVAATRVECLCLTRNAFERVLGPLSQIQEANYLSDPRKQIASFYGKDGPLSQQSVLKGTNGGASSRRSFLAQLTGAQPTEFFAVYRPTSRDAIAKMLGGLAVGKGLNVKGKSAKRNHLSGFVPFCQISDDKHKDEIEPPEPDARIPIFFGSKIIREEVRHELQKILDEPRIKNQVESHREKGKNLTDIDDWAKTNPPVWGLEMPEVVLHEAYFRRQTIIHQAGWETGRKSEPAFMDMNLHAVRGGSSPNVVLYQWDLESPLNPHGLLIAYAEDQVKPVVSDFDTFLVGSKGMTYDTLPSEQQELARWSLDKAEELFKNPVEGAWTSQWIGVLKEARETGTGPSSMGPAPDFGFGDATSYRLIGDIVDVTKSTGAIRHGAECFNFGFPQELDEEYLVVWDGFDDLPWKYHNEEELRHFLLDRIHDNFLFPMNPIWMVRDPGWYDVFKALQDNTETCDGLAAWFPKTSGIIERIQEIHRAYPGGFNPQAAGQPAGFDPTGATARRTYSDLDAIEMADVMMLDMERGTAKLRRQVKQVMAKAGVASMLRKMKSASMEGAAASTAAQASASGS